MTKRKGPGRPRDTFAIAPDQRAAWRAELARQDRTSRGGRPGHIARPGLAELARLMRERVSLAPAPVPVPLHKMGQPQAKRAPGTR